MGTEMPHRGACHAHSQSFFERRFGQLLSLATLLVVAATAVLPSTPLAPILGFRLLRPVVIAALVNIIALYVFSAAMAKRTFYKRVEGVTHT